MKYQARPVVVDAQEITGIVTDQDGSICFLQLADGSTVDPEPGMLARMTPAIGDYWVVQSDGYTYLNPREVFLRKYEPLESVCSISS